MIKCQYRTQGAYLHCRNEASCGVRFQRPGRQVEVLAVCGNHDIALSYRSRRQKWPLFERISLAEALERNPGERGLLGSLFTQ